jgi:phenylacetate-CoA ligase
MGLLLRNVLFPVWHWARRDGANRALRELERNQWLSTEELLALQQRKLASLLRFARKHVPYYRKLFRDAGIHADGQVSNEHFLRLPPLTKRIIRLERESLISEDLSGNGLVGSSTSGSTGEALRFYIDLRSIPYRKASLWRGDLWTGWRIGDRSLRLWGSPIDEKKAAQLRGKLHGWVTGERLLSSFDLSAARLDRYIEFMLAFKPVLLIGYPGPLEQLALHCREREARFPSLKAIVSSAETLWPHQREIIEESFAVRVFNRYGSREVGHIAGECETHEGLHVSVDRLLVEVVDDEGRPCPPGEVGEILITDLDNFGMPLIRYEIGDRGAFAEQRPCRCGRGLPRLDAVEGRTLDIVRTTDGRRIGGTFWTLLLRKRPGLRQFQVIQNALDGVVINFVRDADFDHSLLDYFTQRIQEYCGRNFNVQFVEKSTIDPTVSGKQRLIVSNLPGRPNGTGEESR